MTVTFTSRLSAAATPLKHAWEHTVGSSRRSWRSARIGRRSSNAATTSSASGTSGSTACSMTIWVR